MGGTAPEAPDPYETADAQAGLNKKTADATKDINAHDVFSPGGSSTWQRDENGRPISQTTSLNEESQKAFDANQSLRTNLATTALGMSKNLPTDKFSLDGLPQAGGNVQGGELGKIAPTGGYSQYGVNTRDFKDGVDTQSYGQHNVNSGQVQSGINVADTGNIANAQFDKFMNLAQPQFDKQRNDQNVMLSERGLPIGSEISDNERSRLDTSINNATSQAGWDAILSAGSEQSRQAGLEMGKANLFNSAGGQEFSQNIASGQFAADNQGRDFSQDMANTSLYNQNQNNRFDQDIKSSALAAQLQGQGFSEQMAATGFNNQATGQQFSQGMATESRQDQIRGNALSDNLLERNQSFNELSSYVNGQPMINTPQGSNAGQVNIGSPDLQGGINQKYKTDLDAHNKQQQDFWNAVLGIGKTAAAFI